MIYLIAEVATNLPIYNLGYYTDEPLAQQMCRALNRVKAGTSKPVYAKVIDIQPGKCPPGYASENDTIVIK